MAKRQPRDSKREAYWRGVMTRFGKSGLTVRGFCAQERVSEPSFYAWRRVIRERDAEPRATQAAFVPVVVGDDQDARSRHHIEIELHDPEVGPRSLLLRVPTALPVRQVATLVHALAAAPSTPEAQS